MRFERRAAVAWLCIAVLFAVGPVAAFEPGTERICEPSADGTRFECRDKADEARAPARRSVDETIAAPVPASPPAATAAPPISAVPETTTPATKARELPSYLRGPTTDDGRASAPTAPPPPDPASSPIAAPTAVVPTARTEAAAPAKADAPAPPTAVAAPRTDDPVRMPDLDIQGREDARAFARLPANRYTVEIARARSAGELAALAVALARLDGRVYLVRLRSSDLPTYSVLWSDFPTIDAAREARAALPADVAITSGWPRRIGPLQAELVGH